jgi:hypothetical protein
MRLWENLSSLPSFGLNIADVVTLFRSQEMSTESIGKRPDKAPPASK